MQLLNTLYVTTPESYLHLDNDTLRIEVERQTRLRVPLHHLGSVVCLGNILLSTPLMHRLADDGISLVMLDGHGRFKARLEGPVSGNVLLRTAQHDKARDAAFALSLARSCIAGKIRNCRQVLLRGARESRDEGEARQIARAANDLAAALRALPTAADLDTLRGVEGEAARQYFGALNLLVRTEARSAFQMDGRSRRPPRDRMNALLSFLYSMLMNDCRSAVEAAGLDPQVGYLHALRPGRAALALDLMEEFRPIIVDSVVLTLFNTGAIGRSDFTEEFGAYRLTDHGRRTFLGRLEARMDEQVVHPTFNYKADYRRCLELQTRLLAKTVLGEIESYPPFKVR